MLLGEQYLCQVAAETMTAVLPVVQPRKRVGKGKLSMFQILVLAYLRSKIKGTLEWHLM